MAERNSGSRLRHPILSTQLAWTDRRIRTTERVLDQADRIISLSQTPTTAKNEALLNQRRAGSRLFDLTQRKEQLTKRLGSK